MSNNFRVGQKVVCIDAAPPHRSQLIPGLYGFFRPTGLCRGEVYTVCEVGLTHRLDPKNLPCIRVDKCDAVVWAHRFRPVAERRTDISIFTKMLTKDTVKA